MKPILDDIAKQIEEKAEELRQLLKRRGDNNVFSSKQKYLSQTFANEKMEKNTL